MKWKKIRLCATKISVIRSDIDIIKKKKCVSFVLFGRQVKG